MSLADVKGFLEDGYTPHGDIDDSAHCWVLNPRGVICSHPAIGLGWWYPTARRSERNGAGAAYSSPRQCGLWIGDCLLATPEHYASSGVWKRRAGSRRRSPSAPRCR